VDDGVVEVLEQRLSVWGAADGPHGLGSIESAPLAIPVP